MAQGELIFSIATWLAMAGWLALLLAPLRRGPLILAARVAAASVAAVYTVLSVRAMLVGPGSPPDASFSTLAGVVALLSSPGAILVAWVHLLAFDLFVGSWMTEDAPGAGIPHWVLVPILGLTLMAGPAGLLVYLLVAAARRARART